MCGKGMQERHPIVDSITLLVNAPQDAIHGWKAELSDEIEISGQWIGHVSPPGPLEGH